MLYRLMRTNHRPRHRKQKAACLRLFSFFAPPRGEDDVRLGGLKWTLLAMHPLLLVECETRN